MGTDIHTVVQVRRNGVWADVAPLDDIQDALDSRRYVLFAILADVRNGFGFAGVYTHEPLTPISEPRGFPSDFELCDGEHLGRWMGDHTYSWVTLAELNAYPWDTLLQRGGVVHRDTSIDGNGRPAQWSGGVWGKGSEDYRAVTWSEPVYNAVGTFYTDALPWLRALGLPEDVRLVFGFDS